MTPSSTAGVALRGLHALPLRATQPRGVAVVTKAAAGAFPDPIPGVLPPPKAYLAACAAGKAKAEASVAKTFVMGIAAGAFIGLGCMLAFAITGAIPGEPRSGARAAAPQPQQALHNGGRHPALVKTLASACNPVLEAPHTAIAVLDHALRLPTDTHIMHLPAMHLLRCQ